MADSPPGSAAAPAKLKAGALHWLEVAALGIAIAISGNVSGWNYGLGVGGWGGMFLAALAMAVLFLCLTQSLAELAAALPDAGGFDGYVRRALGPTAAYLTGMSVAIALAVGAGLAMSFGEAYVSAWLGVGGWPVKLAFLLFVMGLQLRGASEAVGLTVAVGVVALVILVAFCLFMAPEYQSARLFSAGTRRCEDAAARMGSAAPRAASRSRCSCFSASNRRATPRPKCATWRATCPRRSPRRSASPS